MIKKSIFFLTFIVIGFNSKSQNISTIAGNGSPTYTGDGIAAISAGFRPHDMKLDAIGNMYFPDRPNARIRKIDTSGIISTVTSAVGSPNSIAFDNVGNMYIADGSYVLKLTPSGVMTTVVTGLSNPYGVSVDTFRNALLIADSYNNVVKRVDATGVVTIIAGNGMAGYTGDNGPATSAQLSWPSHAIADHWGNIYICDASNNRIRKVDTMGIITTIAGVGVTSTGPGAYVGSYAGDGGLATAANFNLPFRLLFDKTETILYVTDNGNNCIRKIDTSGIITLVAGNSNAGFSGDGGLATAAEMSQPNGVAFDEAGNLYIADWLNCRIRKVGSNGSSNGGGSTQATTVEAGGIGINIFPNPNNGVFSINVSASMREKATVMIMTMDGRLVKEMPIQTNSIADINLDYPMPAGMYAVTVVSNSGKVTKLINIQ